MSGAVQAHPEIGSFDPNIHHFDSHIIELEPSLEPRNSLEPLLEQVDFFDVSTPRVNLSPEKGNANVVIEPTEVICHLCGEPSGRKLSHWFCNLCMNKPPVVEMINYKSIVHCESVFSNEIESTVYHRIDTPRVCLSPPINSLHACAVPKNTKKDKKEGSDPDKKV